MTVVTVDSLSVQLGQTLALSNVTCSMSAGRVTGIIGPNASGKSTLLHAIAGDHRPASGRVIHRHAESAQSGVAAHELRGRALARTLAWVPQQSTIAADFLVRDVVALGRFARPSDPGAVDRALAAMDVTDIASKSIHALSGGQQQRVMIARAIAQIDDCPAPLLLLDEPLAALDLRHARVVLEVARSIATRGGSVVMAVHDLSVAASWTDDLVILDGGTVAAAGETARLVDEFAFEPVFGMPLMMISDGQNGVRHYVSPLARID